MNVIFHHGALGDFVLALPVVQGLVDGAAGGPTTLIAPWSKADLARRLHPQVQALDIELFEFSRLHADGGPTALSPAVAQVFETAARIVSFVSNGRDAWSENVARLAPQAKRFFCSTRPAPEWTAHVTDWQRHQMQLQGLPLPQRAPCRRRGAGGPVIVHPGSGGPDKCWPVERFEQLMVTLTESGRKLCPVLGEAEVERWPRDDLERWVSRYNAALPRNLGELCDLLESASAYIGNDAGPTHLAAYLGLRTVAMFGPTDPRHWAPYGAAVTVLAPMTPATMDWLSVDQVLEAVDDRNHF